MNEIVLETCSLTKKYGKAKAVDGISLQVEKGAIYGLIGKNGAGKTTLMKMITGLSNPTQGEITLFGAKGQEMVSQRRRIGLLIENPGIVDNMTGFENLKMKALGMGVYNKAMVNQILELVGLENVGRKKAKNYSLGMKQRLGIGLALIGSPDMLVLDEPINGLDPQGIIEVRKLIEKLNKEQKITILISSHILEELYKIVTHVGIIDKGNIIAQMSKEELNAKCARKMVIGTRDVKACVVVLEELGIHEYAVVSSDTIHVFERVDQVQEVTQALVKANIPVSGIFCQSENLEEFFIELTDKKVS